MADYTKLLEGAFKIVLSKGDGAIRKIVINKKSGKSGDYYQAEKYTEKQAHEIGINDSVVHEDFMIGTEDLDITAITEDGKEIAIFKSGEWAF